MFISFSSVYCQASSRRKNHVIGASGGCRNERNRVDLGLGAKRISSRIGVLDHASENVYLELAPQPQRDVTLLLIDTGLRLDEGLSLEWSDVHLTPNGSRWGRPDTRCKVEERTPRRPLNERTHNLLERFRKLQDRAGVRQW